MVNKESITWDWNSSRETSLKIFSRVRNYLASSRQPISGRVQGSQILPRPPFLRGAALIQEKGKIESRALSRAEILERRRRGPSSQGISRAPFVRVARLNKLLQPLSTRDTDVSSHPCPRYSQIDTSDSIDPRSSTRLHFGPPVAPFDPSSSVDLLFWIEFKISFREERIWNRIFSFH